MTVWYIGGRRGGMGVSGSRRSGSGEDQAKLDGSFTVSVLYLTEF